MIINEILGQDAHWQINKKFAREFGIESALLLSDLISKWKYFKYEEYFFNTSENIENDTTLSRYQQDRALKILQENLFIECKLMGVPAKKFFKVNQIQLLNFFDPSLQITYNPVCKKLTNKDAKNLQTINKNKVNNNKEINNKESVPLEFFPTNTPLKEKYKSLAFSKIKNFTEFYKEFEYNKKYLLLSYRFWELWKENNPNNKTITDAKLVNWYEAIRLIVEVDKQSIDRVVGVYKYFERCADETKGYDKWWFNTIKSVVSLRHTDRNGEYRLDKLTDLVNEKLQKDDKFWNDVKEAIKKLS